MTVTPAPLAPKLATGFDTGLSNSDGITAVNTPTIVGTAAPGAAVVLYDTDGTTVLGKATADATSGAYSIAVAGTADQNGIPINLDDGVHLLTVTADVAGSDTSGPSQPLKLTIDTQAPDAPTAPALAAASDTGISALDGVTSATVLTLAGRSEPGATVRLLDGAAVAGQAVAAADGSYSITTGTLASGAHSFTVQAADVAGNVSKASAATAVTVDTTAPAAPPAPTLAPGSDTGVSRTDGTTSDTTPVVTGTAEAGSTVVLHDFGSDMLGQAKVNADGSYAIASGTLLTAAHELAVVATDPAGNASAASNPLDIVVDDVEGTASGTVEAATASAPAITFTVHFDQPIVDRRGISPDDFTLVTTGTAFGDVESATGSGQTGYVTVTGLGGSGTVSLAFAPGSEITDLAGNQVALTSTQSHDVDAVAGGDVTPVSAGPSGVVGPGQDPSASYSGRYVAFDSSFNSATGLTDVYVKDMQTEGLTRISVGLDGQANDSSFLPSLSANGQVIVFDSKATDLVSGLPPTHQTNVYLATLTPADPASGDSVVVGQIQLVSAGNGVIGSDPDSQPVVSGDGSTIAFTSDQGLLPGVETGVENVYAYDVATGTLTLVTGGTGMDEYGYVEQPSPYVGETEVFAPVADRPAGQGGDFNSVVTSISADGREIAFQSYATDLGSGPLPMLNGSENGPLLRSFVYNTSTGALTVLDGNGVFGAVNDFNEYQTVNPQLSENGTEVTYDVDFALDSQVVFERNLVTEAVTQLTPGPEADFLGDADNDATPSGDGSYIAYAADVLGATSSGNNSEIMAGPASAPGSGDTGYQGFQPAITASGNAVVFTAALGDGYEVLEDTLGVTAGIDPVGTGDEINAAQLAAIGQAGVLTITGRTDAPVGLAVQVQLGPYPGTPGPVLTGTVTSPGVWTVWVPSAELAADGTYLVAATVLGTTGESARVTRQFTLDTAAPATPDAPKLDPGSDTGLAHDGSMPDTDTPTVTGTAEAGSTVTLIDQGGLTPGLVLGTDIADGNGVYAITSAVLTQGKHELAVTATDGAGNVSAASDPLPLTVDSIVPDAPQTPVMVPQSTPDPAGGPPKVTNVSVDNPSGDGSLTQETAPILSGTAIPGTTVTLYDTDGISVLGTAVADAKGAYSITSRTLTDGMHMLTVSQTKPEGDVSAASGPFDLTVDTLPPLSPTITSVGGPLTVNAEHTSQVDVNGTAEPGSTVTLHVNMDNTVSGTATADAEGDYTIEGFIPPAAPKGDDGTRKLTVIATDAAGNASQPSAVTIVTVDHPATPSLVTPAGNPITGTDQDGYISGATAFADLNGNGAFDPGEPTGVTALDGSFALFGAAGATLIATGGTDINTGLTLPGALEAPAPEGDTVVISPLTTFLAALMRATGLGLDAANTAVDAALGLSDFDQIETLDVPAQYLPTSNGNFVGDPAIEAATAKLADTAAMLSAVIQAASGGAATQAAAFVAVFDAMARAAVASSPLDLSTQAGIAAILADAAQEADPGLALPAALASAAAQVVAAGNAALDALGKATADNPSTEPSLVTDAASVQRLEQAAAAPALANATAALLPAVVDDYTGAALQTAIAAAEAEAVLPPPRLAATSDTGLSDTDEVTDDDTPVFVGTALPGSVVEIETVGTYERDTSYGVGSSNQVVGVGTADSTGHYSIPSLPLSETFVSLYGSSQTGYVGQFEVVAVQASAGSALTAGSLASLTPYATTPHTFVVVQPGEPQEAPTIDSVASVASPGNDATHTAVQVYGLFDNSNFANSAQPGTLSIYADGRSAPITTGIYGSQTAALTGYTLTTPPLSAGPHTLTVVVTLPSGATESSAPFASVVTVPGTLDGAAAAGGPLVGGTVFIHTTAEQVAYGRQTSFDVSQSSGPISPGAYEGHESGDVETVSDAAGAFALPVPDAGDVTGVENAWDPLLGLPLDGGAPSLTYGYASDNVFQPDAALFAPAGATEISPLSSLVVASPPDYADGTDPATVAAATEDRLFEALGLPPNQDLLSEDPLTRAEAGDSALFLADVKLLDTVTLLTPLDAFSFGQLADYLAFRQSLDFDDPQSVLGLLQQEEPITLRIPAGVLQDVATIIAASNAAIDAYAQAASGPADLISYTLAAQYVTQHDEAGALATAYEQITAAVEAQCGQTGASSPAPAILDPLVTADTGDALDAAIAAELADMTQVTSFAPDGGGTTDAATAAFRITFSQAVSGVSAGEFSVVESGVADASVTGVSAVASSHGTQYDVTVSTGIGAGQLSVAYDGTGLLAPNGRPIVTGTFEKPEFLPVDVKSLDSGATDEIAVADLNGDGRPDIVASSITGYTETFGQDTAIAYDLQVYLNQGDGTFAPAALGVTLPNNVTDFALGDVNLDGKPDIVATSASFDEDDNGFRSTLTFLPGNGDGTFGAPVYFDAGTSATRLAVGDFDSDGRLDIVTNGGPAGTLAVLLGNGNGTFRNGPTLTLAAADTASNVAVADVNGDGHADIIASDEIAGTLDVFLGNGAGTFGAAKSLPVGSPQVFGAYETPNVLQDTPVDESDNIAVGGVTSDGIPDIVTVNATDRTVVLLRGNGDGTFTPQTAYAFPTGPAPAGIASLSGLREGDSFLQAFDPASVVIADMNNDGVPDLLVGDGNDSTVELLGNGDGTFRVGPETSDGLGGYHGGGPALFERPSTAIAADLDGDGRSDIVTGGYDPDQSDDTGSGTYGVGVLLSVPPDVLPATSTPVTVERANQAVPVLSEASGPGELDRSGNAYALDLGEVAQGSTAQLVQFALRNQPVEGLTDAFTGVFGVPAATGFTVTGASLPDALSEGQSYDGLMVSVDASTLGSHTQTITFAPHDESAAVTTYAPESALSDNIVSTTTTADGAGELPLITLTVTDDVVPATDQALLGPVGAMSLPNVRVGDVDSKALPVANAAASGAPTLSVTAQASGDATVSGAVTDLPPGGTDDADLAVGLSTDQAGAESGTVTLLPVSGDTVTLASVPVAVTGSVFRPAVAAVIASNPFVHVGDPGTVVLSVTNATPADGYSEALDASVSDTNGPVTVDGSGAVTGIAPGATSTGLAVTLPTGVAGTVTGSAFLVLTSDGGTGEGSIDGLGPSDLPGQVVAVAVTVDNYAAPVLSATVGGAAATVSAGVLNLGTLQLGSGPVLIALTESNAASGPADLLAASFTSSQGAGFTDALGSVSGLGAGQGAAAGTVTLSTSTAGTFTETITATPTGSNSSGYSGALAAQTLTVTGTVAAGGTGGTPPTAPSIALVSPTNGSLAQKAIVDTPTPTVAGATSAGAAVSVLAGGAGVGSTSADPATGAYTDTLSAGLGLGLGTLSASATDGAGTTAGTQTASAFTLPSPGDGVSTAALASIDLGRLLDGGFVFQLTPGTEAVDLLDGVLSVGPDTDEAYVQRLYEGLFGRGDDLSGMSHWIGQLDAGASKADIASGFLGSAEFLSDYGPASAIPGEQFIGMLYQGLLGRAPTAGDVSFWSGDLAQYGQAAVLQGIADSPEAKAHNAGATAQVWAPSVLGTLNQELYGTGLGREAEPAGNAYWQGVLPGLTTAQAAALFVATPEFQSLHAGQDPAAYVQSLFDAGLGRAPTAAEAQPLVAGLQGGTLSEADVLVDVATSPGAAAYLTRNLNTTQPAASVYQPTDVFAAASATPTGFVFRG